jgi:hypothetical protein
MVAQRLLRLVGNDDGGGGDDDGGNPTFDTITADVRVMAGSIEPR